MAETELTGDDALKSGHYVRGPKVEVFVEHRLYDKKGRVVRDVGQKELQAIAQDALKRYEASGNVAAFGPGHTFDDEYEMGKDGKPRLVKKFPETEQPPIWGYLDPHYEIAKRPGDGKLTLYANTYVRRELEYPEQGVLRRISGPEAFREFPHRSPEYYAGQGRISYLALLRREPKLDMGIAMYAKEAADKALYIAGGDGAVLAAADYGRCIRYAIGVDELMAIPTTRPVRYEPEPIPPTEPPADDKPIEPEGGVQKPPAAEPEPEGAGAGELPEEHRYAAEMYAKHSLGMHHTRAAHLMHRYAKECGMAGDMMSPMEPQRDAMAAPSGTNGAPPAPVHPQPVEPTRMSKASPEVQTLKREVAEMRAELALAKAQKRETERQAIFDEMAHTYEIDPGECMRFAKDLPDPQFAAFVELTKKQAGQAPVSQDPIDDWRRDPANAGTPQRLKKADKDNLSVEEVNKRLDYMRKLGLSDWDATCERYEKEVVNGKVR